MRLISYDCEVFAYDWLVTLKDKETGVYTCIWNDNEALKMALSDDCIYVGFNSKHYDQYIIKAIAAGLSPEEIKRVNDFIIAGGQGWQCPLLDGIYFRFSNVDIRDDTQQGLSLKAIEGHLGMSVRESSVPFDIDRPLTPEEKAETEFYCKHDVDTAERLIDIRKDYLKNKINLGRLAGLDEVKAMGKIDIDFDYLDKAIRENVPSGCEVNETAIYPTEVIEYIRCYKALKDPERLVRSIGSLGGGNHFIEIDTDSEGVKYLVIHTGSRNLGKQVAEYYQNLAIETMQGKDELIAMQEKLIADYKAQGRKAEIQKAIAELHRKFSPNPLGIPKELCYLTGKHREDYLHDMKACQHFAATNRYEIANRIVSSLFGSDIAYWDLPMFETVHNYIEFGTNMVRKGAISAKAGEKLLIPINMRDGCIIGIGKGNEDWNCSAPHGAGRVMSRSKAKELVSLEEYEDSMKGIFTTSVSRSTIDESPMAYKTMEEIIANIADTVEVVNIIKPVYNFKASE